MIDVRPQILARLDRRADWYSGNERDADEPINERMAPAFADRKSERDRIILDMSNSELVLAWQIGFEIPCRNPLRDVAMRQKLLVGRYSPALNCA